MKYSKLQSYHLIFFYIGTLTLFITKFVASEYFLYVFFYFDMNYRQASVDGKSTLATHLKTARLKTARDILNLSNSYKKAKLKTL